MTGDDAVKHEKEAKKEGVRKEGGKLPATAAERLFRWKRRSGFGGRRNSQLNDFVKLKCYVHIAFYF